MGSELAQNQPNEGVNASCALSGEDFLVSAHEQRLREAVEIEGLPSILPELRIRHLGAFWPHFHLHPRKCDATGANIVSVYPPDCVYPVWHKDHWMKNANPPSQDFQPAAEVFPQMWQLFQQSPIAHNIGVGNENCEYTDDWWYSRNCYLGHSGFQNEDVRYSYRARNCRDCEFIAFCFDCELCVDAVDCRDCFNTIYALNCRMVSDSAFVYDCRNCSHCLFCCNLRNKKYCIGNKQLTQEEYEAQLSQWDFSSRKIFDTAKAEFFEMMRTKAFHRAVAIDKCDNSSGNYLENAKDCTNCFFINGSEDCVNSVRSVSGHDKSCLDSLGHFGGELIYMSCNAQDNCYRTRFCFNVVNSRFLDYCASCFQCEHCFGCAGLVNAKYHIFNREYPREEYEQLRGRIIDLMKRTGEWGQFFPGHFSPVPYNESWTAAHFPLEVEDQELLGFRTPFDRKISRPSSAEPTSAIPDSLNDVDEQIEKRVFWDDVVKRPIRISADDVAFARKIGAPLNNQFYASRLKENYCWMQYDGHLRETRCGKSGVPIQTHWSRAYDGRILCEEEYLNILT